MRFLVGLTAVFAVVGFGLAAMAEDLVPRWSIGPTIPFAATGRGADGLYHTDLLAAGVGVQTTVNWVDSQSFPWIGTGLPIVVAGGSAGDELRISAGLTLTVGGNLSIGALYDLGFYEKGVGTGLATGYSSWGKNGRLIVGMVIPIGGNAGIWSMGR